MASETACGIYFDFVRAQTIRGAITNSQPLPAMNSIDELLMTAAACLAHAAVASAQNTIKKGEKISLVQANARLSDARRNCKAAIDFYADLMRRVDDGTFGKDHHGQVIGAITAGEDGTIKVTEIAGWRREDEPKP